MLGIAFALLALGIPAGATAHDHGEMKPTVSVPGAIGGPFALTDQDGKKVTDKDFSGRVMLVFFGFTHCPDICPVTVSSLSKTMEILGYKADKVAPVFITVDPERDTPEAMKAYLANFDKRIAGLSGKPKEIKQAADAYKVYYAEAGEKHKPGGDYMVNHSGILYMMGADGNYVRHFSYDAPAQEIADAVKDYLK